MPRPLLDRLLLDLLLAVWPASSGAVLFTVDSAVDAVDANPGDGACAAAGGACTLRAAVMETNHLPGADEITIPAGTYLLTLPNGAGADEATGDLDVADAVTIAGGGPGETVVDVSGVPGFVLSVEEVTGRVVLGDLTLTGAAETGLRVDRAGDMRVSRVSISGNANGGIAAVGADLVLEGSTVFANSGVFGGIFAAGGRVDVVNSTISGNEGFCRVETCREGCGGPFGAGAIWALDAELRLVFSTVTDNRCPNDRGEIGWALLSTLPLTTTVGSLISNSGVFNCDSPLASAGHNLASDASCGLSAPTDLLNTDPLLGPLADNGGPALTHEPLPGSPAIDAIPVEDCTWDDDGDPGTPKLPVQYDQRGYSRPKGIGCDIGAVEVPEPGQVLLVLTGGLVLAAARRRRRA